MAELSLPTHPEFYRLSLFNSRKQELIVLFSIRQYVINTLVYFLVAQVLLVIFETFFSNIFVATFFRNRIYLHFSQNFFMNNPSKNSTFFGVLMIWSHHPPSGYPLGLVPMPPPNKDDS